MILGYNFAFNFLSKVWFDRLSMNFYITKRICWIIIYDDFLSYANMNCPFYSKIIYFSYSFSKHESHDTLKIFKDISEEQISLMITMNWNHQIIHYEISFIYDTVTIDHF